MRGVHVALLLGAALLASGRAGAQEPPGAIGGTVSASTGFGLPGATVTVTNPETGARTTAVTGDEGQYTVGNLPPASGYQVRAELDGFAPVNRGSVTLTSGGHASVSFILVPFTSESLLVMGHTPLREQQRSTIQQTVPEALAHSIPLIGRDFIALASLTPGFTGNPYAPSPNGQISWSNNVIVDGASHFSKWRSAARTFYSGYSLEAIREVQVLSSQFSSEYGEALASVTTALTKSGSNEPHGSALYFGQAGVLNDAPVFSAEKPPASSSRFGFTMGGPVARDRTFFFGSYEGRVARSSNIVVSPAAPQAEVPNDEDEHLAFFKVDHRLGSSDLISARYNSQFFRWTDEPGGLSLPGTGIRYVNDVQTALFTATRVVSSRMLNQSRFQFARYDDARTDRNPSVYVSRAGYSIEGGTLGPKGFGATPEDTYEGADTLSRPSGSHSLKFGGGFKYVRSHNESLPYGYGAYYFAGPPSLYPSPYAFVQGVAAPSAATSVDPRSVSGFAFAQDDWRLGPRVTANIGLRYDIEQIDNVNGYNTPADKNNLQPRLSASWLPRGGGLVIRGGVGIYTQQHLLYYINRAQLEGPAGSALITLTPDSTLMPVFPNAVDASVLAHVPRDVYVVDPAFRNPWSVQAAGGAEYPLFGFDLAADYVYLAGHDLMSIVDTNAPASIVKPDTRSVAEADLTRPLVPVAGGYRKVISLGNEGRSWYHGLQVKANRTVGRLQVIASYTLARADDVANYLLPEDSRNIAADKARSDADVRHNVTAGLTWRLPFNDAPTAGWTLSAAGQFRSNRPYTISWGDDRNGTTQNDARPGDRNTGETDTFRNIDLALSRRLPLGGGTLEIRFEAFNVLSITNYDEYVGALNSPYYSQPITAFPKRRLQFAGIFRF